MREVNCGICCSGDDSRSMRRTAERAMIARTGPTKKSAMTRRTRNPIRGGTGEIKAQALGGHNSKSNATDGLLEWSGCKRKLGKNVAFASSLFPTFELSTCTHGQVFPQPVQRSPGKKRGFAGCPYNNPIYSELQL